MLYGDVHVIEKEVQDHLSGLLHKKENIPLEICFRIVEEFSAVQGHVSAKGFHEALQNKKLDVSEQAVDLVLQLFSEIGFAAQLQFEGEDFKRYEPLRPDKHHDHFICVKCKKIIEFSNSQLEKLQDSLIFEKGARPLFHKLEVYGVCSECHPQNKKIVPITLIAENKTVKLSKVEGGIHLRRRLTDLGFVPNASIKIIKNSYFGPLVVELKNSRLAIGRGEAQNIFITEE